jgi:SpoVK/Ycf46/Vps4 family AAA+-type ATPase
MGSGSSHHRVEEVAEFLRRIPEAIKNKVLIVAMTNRIDMIDPAILRRGRFDHHIKVDMASEAEISSLLKKLISEIPHEEDIDIPFLANQLQGRPLSDVTFTVREAARLAARSGINALNQQCCLESLKSTITR